jgi:hypothetical protein
VNYPRTPAGLGASGKPLLPNEKRPRISSRMADSSADQPAGKLLVIRAPVWCRLDHRFVLSDPAMKRLRGLVVFAVLIGGCFATEFVSRRRVNPTGRVSTLGGYLAWRPSAERFAAVEVNGRPHVIAYGPMSSWLLLSSGPSAYAFDDAGRLVDWSPDGGPASSPLREPSRQRPAFRTTGPSE